MRRAIEMRKEERIERHRMLMKRVRQHDACNWMVSFLHNLRACRGMEDRRDHEKQLREI
jgi:trehalose-6-phosphate synthase